ncbi:MAG: hypothetical protein NW224_29325, partial [Leptolyngbyaceae cyanobacterium bins.302]|nr:hypothetical protein [Leptolyngbyaceae cyanobacterium bins.302]
MNRIQFLTRWFCPVVLVAGLTNAGVTPAQLPPAQTILAQTTAIAPCQPPQPNEFLLLVITRNSESQAQVNQLLPPNTSISTCSYLNDTVTRVGGFRTVERTNAWARYINETTGLAAFVVRPAETPASAASPPAQPSNSGVSTKPAPTAKPTPTTGYNPKPLGPGYAVLV